ncbi:hypothetical protein [Aquiflexum lacus]|uniref:hypothetical protein n=1 Tax=Aquiflexum lacus TaxID=2483805 RepID=UPI0018935BAA|nr:hypothetical protein [Aquiflexum lacus]
MKNKSVNHFQDETRGTSQVGGGYFGSTPPHFKGELTHLFTYPVHLFGELTHLFGPQVRLRGELSRLFTELTDLFGELSVFGSGSMGNFDQTWQVLEICQVS